MQCETYIEAENLDKWNYPASRTLNARLVNLDYDEEDEYSVQYPANELITFIIYKSENGSTTPTGKTYTKLTDAYGRASVSLKLDPADYEIDVIYGGNEEYMETTHSVQASVGGTKEVPKSNNNKSNKENKSKSKVNGKSSKNTKKYKTVTTYWTKCGQSPDKKHKEVIAIGKTSASTSDAKKRGISMTTTYKTVFKNKCPHCGRAELRFDGGASNKCITSPGAHGRGYKIKVPEHEITCNHCDSDFDAVTGLEKNYGHSTRLKTVQKPVKSSTSEFNKLVKGKLKYGTKKVSRKSKKKTSTKTRTVKGNVPKKVKEQALAIVGDSKGVSAAKMIEEWFRKHMHYEKKYDFYQSTSTTLKRRIGNCCCLAELFLQMCDAAGCTDYIDMYFVHVHGSQGGHVYTKLVTRKTKNWRYVDPTKSAHGAAGWGYYVNGSWGSPPGTQSSYPSRPI